MQHREEQSREPSVGESATSGQTWDLGQRIYARYGPSPGVMSLGLGPGLASQIFQFSDRLPLLHTLHRRWGMDGIPLPTTASPLWLRALASPKSADSSTLALRIVEPASAGLPAGISHVGPSASNLTAPQAPSSLSTSSKFDPRAVLPGSEVHVHPPTRSSGSWVSRADDVTSRQQTGLRVRQSSTADESRSGVPSDGALTPLPAPGVPHPPPGDSAANKVVRTHTAEGATEAIETTEPTAALSSVRDGAALPLVPAFPGSHYSGTVGDEVSSPSTAGMTHKAGGGIAYDSSLATPALCAVDSAASKVVPPGTATEGMEPTAAPLRVPDGVSLPSTPTSCGSHQLRTTRDEGSSRAAAGRIHESGDNVSNAQVQRKAGAKQSYETKAPGPTPGGLPLVRQNPAASAVDGKNLSTGAESPGLKLSTLSQIQLGPPVFWRPSKGVRSKANRQNMDSPENEQMDNSSDMNLPANTSRSESVAASFSLLREGVVTGGQHVEGGTVLRRPPSASPLHMSTSKAATEVVRAATPVPENVLPTNGLRKIAAGSTRNALTDVSAPPQSPQERCKPDQTDSARTRVMAAHSIAKFVGGSEVPPLLQHNATALLSTLSKSSNTGNSAEGATNRINAPAGQAPISSAKHSGSSVAHQAKPTVPPFVQRKVTASHSPRSESFKAENRAESADYQTDSLAGQAAISSVEPENLPSSIAPSLVSSSNSVLNLRGGADLLVSGGLGSSLLQRQSDCSIAHQVKSTVPFAHRRATAAPWSRTESSNAGNAVEGAAYRMDSSAGQAAISSAKPENLPWPIPAFPVSSPHAVLNQPGDTDWAASGGLGSSLLQQQSEASITHRAKSRATVQETGVHPVGHPWSVPSASPVVQPAVFAMTRIQPSAHASDATLTSQIFTPRAKGVLRAAIEEPTTGVVITAEPPNVPAVASRKLIIDQASDATTANLTQSQLRERLVLPNAVRANPAPNRVNRHPYSGSAMGYPALASDHQLGLPQRLEITHRDWLRTNVTSTSTHPEANHGVTHSPTNFNMVQRSAATSAGSRGVQTPAPGAGLPDQSKQVSQNLASGDIAQLTNRVYELLLRRLASEKQQRGL